MEAKQNPRRDVIVIADSDDDFQAPPKLKRQREVVDSPVQVKKRRHSFPSSDSKNVDATLDYLQVSTAHKNPSTLLKQATLFSLWSPEQEPTAQPEPEKKQEATPKKQGTLSAWLGCAPPPPKLPETKKEKDKKWKSWYNKGPRKTMPNCPFYKRIPLTSIIVDAFQYKYDTPQNPVYFLSHFHSDHYNGLNASWSDDCSKITANLVNYKLGIKNEYLCPLPMNDPVTIGDVKVTLLDAHHCPGAVLFLFQLPNGNTHLHTGDFRYNPDLLDHQFCGMVNVENLFLDTTYCDPMYIFPSQSQTLESDFKRADTIIAVGSYTIGKEKLFIAMAEHYRCKIYASSKKWNVLKRLEYPAEILQLFTQDKDKAKIHVMSMFEFSFAKLGESKAQLKWPFSRIVAVKPTGWTFANPTNKGKNSTISKRYSNKQGTLSVVEIPYSFEELRAFVKLVNPKFIVPTVNCHNPAEVKKAQQLLRS